MNVLGRGLNWFDCLFNYNTQFEACWKDDKRQIVIDIIQEILYCSENTNPFGYGQYKYYKDLAQREKYNSCRALRESIAKRFVPNNEKFYKTTKNLFFLANMAAV